MWTMREEGMNKVDYNFVSGNKFIDATGEMLNEIAMDGFLDEEVGSVIEDGIWLGLILEHKAIIQEDEQGFFDYEIFETEEETQRVFDYIIQDIELRNI